MFGWNYSSAWRGRVNNVLTDEQKAIVKDRQARRMRIQALTVNARAREAMVAEAVRLAETPKPERVISFDTSREVYAGKEVCPWYFEGEERRVNNRERAFDRDEANHITRFDTLKQFVNPMKWTLRVWDRLSVVFG